MQIFFHFPILSFFGRGLGIPALLGFAGYEAGKFAIDAISSGLDSQEVKYTKQSEQFLKNLQGKTLQQKREYIEFIDINTLDPVSRDIVKNIRTAYDYKNSQSGIPSVNSAVNRKKKDDPNKNPNQSMVRVRDTGSRVLISIN